MATPTAKGDIEVLLDYLKRTRGFDFTGYKQASLARRIEKRMHTVGVARMGDYADYLEVHPEEFPLLFNTILINVTSFFRDDTTWDFLATSVIPELLARRGTDQPIRLWSAGCASGQEAYSLAMVVADAVGLDAFRDRVKIYATDADEEALAYARAAEYTEREVADVPPALLTRFFDHKDGTYAFRKEWRRNVIFGRHDLVQDAPISRIDLLCCRNTLMYFNAETQSTILARFHFALNDDGVLVLGRAETLMTHSSRFTPLDLKRRVSMKVPGPVSVRERQLTAATAAGSGAAEKEHNRQHRRLRELALDALPTAQIVIDISGTVIAINERARQTLGVSRSDMGRALRDLTISYRPVDLRSAIDRVQSEGRAIVLADAEWNTKGESQWFDIHVTPLFDNTGVVRGMSVTFSDVTLAKRLSADLAHTSQAIETAYEELQSTNEELETTNEELQSTVEELETTNEELQSTNEEMETMNEELQSTNEELQTVNDEHSDRGDDLQRVNTFLENILSSIRSSVAVVDRDLRILIWNSGAEELWGIREGEVLGKHLLGLNIGLPTETLKHMLQRCLAGGLHDTRIVVPAVNRDGRAIGCHVVCTALIGPDQAVRGAVLIMDADGYVAGPAGGGVPADLPRQ